MNFYESFSSQLNSPEEFPPANDHQLKPLPAPEKKLEKAYFEPNIHQNEEVDPRVSQVVLKTSELVSAKVYNAISRIYLSKKPDGTYKDFPRNNFIIEHSPLHSYIGINSTVHYRSEPWPEKTLQFFERANVADQMSKTFDKIYKVVYQDGSYVQLDGEDENGQPIITKGSAPEFYSPNIEK